MVQPARCARLLFEPAKRVRVVHCVPKELDRHPSTELQVARHHDPAHPPRPSSSWIAKRCCSSLRGSPGEFCRTDSSTASPSSPCSAPPVESTAPSRPRRDGMREDADTTRDGGGAGERLRGPACAIRPARVPFRIASKPSACVRSATIQSSRRGDIFGRHQAMHSLKGRITQAIPTWLEIWPLRPDF